jgi:hypothetical protein
MGVSGGVSALLSSVCTASCAAVAARWCHLAFVVTMPGRQKLPREAVSVICWITVSSCLRNGAHASQHMVSRLGLLSPEVQWVGSGVSFIAAGVLMWLT